MFSITTTSMTWGSLTMKTIRTDYFKIMPMHPRITCILCLILIFCDSFKPFDMILICPVSC